MKVSESAAKEYQIEEALTKMEGEWTDSRLEIVGYRETGTGILKGVDEINTVLDEQVLLLFVVEHEDQRRHKSLSARTLGNTFKNAIIAFFGIGQSRSWLAETFSVKAVNWLQSTALQQCRAGRRYSNKLVYVHGRRGQ